MRTSSYKEIISITNKKQQQQQQKIMPTCTHTHSLTIHTLKLMMSHLHTDITSNTFTLTYSLTYSPSFTLTHIHSCSHSPYFTFTITHSFILLFLSHSHLPSFHSLSHSQTQTLSFLTFSTK